MSLVSRTGLARPFRLHTAIQTLQVLGLQPVKAVLADTGHEVHANGDLVPVVRVLTDGRLGDVLNPVLKPLLNRPRLARLLRRTRVALLLQLLDFLDQVLARLARQVSAVRLPVVLVAHRHTGVPTAVFPEVDRGFAVGAAGALLLLCHRQAPVSWCRDGDRGGGLSCPGVLPPRAWSSGSFGLASPRDVFGGCVRRHASETADVDGLQFAGADQCEAGGPADAEAASGLFDGEEYEGRVVVGGGGEGAVFVQGSLRWG